MIEEPITPKLRPRDTAAVARRPWKYVNAEDGFALTDHYYAKLKNAVKKYRQANNYPIGLLFDEDFDHNLCTQTPEQCRDYLPPTLWQKASALTQALITWGKQGFPVRPEAELQSILAICRACEDYAGESGMAKIACKRCGCSKLKQAFSTTHCPIGKW